MRARLGGVAADDGEPLAADGGAGAVGEDVDLLGVGVFREELDQPGERRRQFGRGHHVARIAQEILGGRPVEQEHDRVPAGEMLKLGGLAGGALEIGVGAVDIDDDVVVAALGERIVDRGEPGLGIGRQRLAAAIVACSSTVSRWRKGRCRSPARVDHS